MLKTFKYRMYPTKKQIVILQKHFGCVRFVYNYFLNKRIEFYTQNKDNSTKKSYNYFDTAALLTELKTADEFVWLNEVNSQALQMSLRNLDNAYTNFFKHNASFPKFKSKRNRKSFQIPQRLKITGNHVFIPKCKTGIKTIIDRTFLGNIKTCTVSQVPSGKYFISVLVDTETQPIEFNETNPTNVLGIDLGIKSFAVLSDGTVIDNPKFLEKSLTKLKTESKILSKKKLGSKNRNKQRIRVAKVHEKITNQRDDFIHKLSHKIVCENQTHNVIAIENLSIKDMMRKSNLAFSIGSASWYKFRLCLEYKSKWYGKKLVTIGKFEPSSKICSDCGYSNFELTLADREWTCKNCNTHHNRDLNAAKNIANFGYLKYTGQVLPDVLVENQSFDSLKQETPALRQG